MLFLWSVLASVLTHTEAVYESRLFAAAFHC